MKNGVFGLFLVLVSAVVGYAVASRCVEETKDFR